MKLISVLFSLFSVCLCQNASLKVYTVISSPFVERDGSTFSGFAIDLWKEVAERSNVGPYELVVVTGVGDVMAAIKNGTADVAVGDFSITAAREQFADFSHVIFNGGLGALTRATSLRTEVYNLFVQIETFVVISMVVILVYLSAHVIWVMEKRVNPRFPTGYVDGIWQSLWWSVATITTTGYGDKVPVSRTGRTFGMFWMFVGVVVSGVFAGTFSSALTVAQVRQDVRSAADLLQFVVASVRHTTADEWLSEQGVPTRLSETLADALDELDEHLADFLVFDSPLLRHLATVTDPDKYRMVLDQLQSENYGFAVPDGSALLSPVNAALLQMQESGEFETLKFKYFGSPVAAAAAAAVADAENSVAIWQLAVVGVAGALVVLNCGIYCSAGWRARRRRHVVDEHGEQITGEIALDATGQKVFLARRVKVNGSIVRMTSAEALLFDKLHRLETALSGLSSGVLTPDVVEELPMSDGGVTGLTSSSGSGRKKRRSGKPGGNVMLTDLGSTSSTTTLLEAGLGESDTPVEKKEEEKESKSNETPPADEKKDE